MQSIDRDRESQCWVFTGVLNRGYGQLAALNGRGRQTTVRAHRLAYELFVGPLTRDVEIHHVCGNKACCNPEHLQPVSDLDHKRADPRWVGNRTHCKNGHPLGGDNLSPGRLKAGKRLCRVCRNARQQKYRYADIDAHRKYAREYTKAKRNELRKADD